MHLMVSNPALRTLRTRTFGLLRASLVLGGLMAPIALGGMGRAEARVPEGATGGQAAYCRHVQSLYDNLVRDLAMARTVEEQRSLKRQIERLQNVWAVHCRDPFGSISRDVVLVPEVLGAAGSLSQVEWP
jgi:hypothetical protein